jgi:hypothetical protein
MMKQFVFFLFGVIAFTSCTSNEKEIKGRSTGNPGRLIIVSTDPLYKDIGETIKEVFYEPQPWLSQAEAYFNISLMNPSSFRRSFLIHQSILFLVTRQNFSKLSPYLPYSEADHADRLKELFSDSSFMPVMVRDKWAIPQNVYYLFAENSVKMREKLLKSQEYILPYIYNEEIASLKKRLFRGEEKSNKMYVNIHRHLGMGVAIPDKFDLLKHENGFFWYGERYVGSQNAVFCYNIPYTDTHQFSKEYLFRIRDSVMKENVPGPEDFSYIKTTDLDLFPRFYEHKEVNGLYGKKIRGWWTVHGAYLGGPYVLHAILNKEKTHIFMVEGFVYRPNHSKSKNLRTLEAVGLTAQ